MKKDKLVFNKGISLVELLIAISLFGALSVVLMDVILFAQSAGEDSSQKNTAVYLSEEGIEAARSIRDNDFDDLDDSGFIDGDSGIEIQGDEWVLVETPDVTGGYTRTIEIDDIDATTKRVESTVSWTTQSGSSESTDILTYLTNWQRAVSTTCTWTDTQVVNTEDYNGTRATMKVRISGDHAYVISDGNNPDFLILDISNPTSISTLGTLNLSGRPEMLDLYGDYAYVTSNNNNNEMIVVDISNPNSPSVVFTYNSAGNTNGESVFATDDVIVYSRSSGNPDVYIFDNTNKTSPTLTDSLAASGRIYDMTVSGNYAYLASSHNSQEVIVLNLSNISNVTVEDTLDLPSSNNMRITEVFGNVLLVSGNGGDLHIVDISDPSNISIINTVELGGTTYDIAVNDDFTCAFLANTQNASEFQVVDISTLLTASLVETLNLPQDLRGAAFYPAGDSLITVGNQVTGPNYDLQVIQEI